MIKEPRLFMGLDDRLELSGNLIPVWLVSVETGAMATQLEFVIPQELQCPLGKVTVVFGQIPGLPVDDAFPYTAVVL